MKKARPLKKRWKAHSKNVRRKLEGQVRLRTAELKKTNLVLAREVRQRIEYQEYLEHSYEFLEKIFLTTTFLIVYLDTEGAIIRVNNAFAKAEGKDPDFFCGKNLFDLFPSEEHRNIVTEAVKGGEPLALYEKEFRFLYHPERGLTYWDCNLLPVKNKAGTVEGIIMCLIDRTKVRQAREELHRKEKELSDSKRLSEIGRLAAIVAHELRNPLGVIRTAAFNIRRKAGNPLLETNLANIEKKILESEQIISNLLSYSRVKLPRFEAVRIVPLLNETIAAAFDRFKKRKMTVSKHTLEIKDEIIWADPVQIKEVFNNILANAYDACADKEGLIVVTARKQGQENIEVGFRDNGVGMTADQMKRLFEPFFTTKAKGTGLGLAICRQMIELHSGQIRVESKRDEGTVFTISLPIRRDRIARLTTAHYRGG